MQLLENIIAIYMILVNTLSYNIPTFSYISERQLNHEKLSDIKCTLIVQSPKTVTAPSEY